MSTRYRPTFLGNTAIAGVGYTPITRDSGASVLELAVTACRRAVEDAGIAPDEVDGIVTYSLLNDSIYGQAVAAGLGSPELKLDIELNFGGQAPCAAVAMAAMAVETGMANNVLVFRAMNGRSQNRIGTTAYDSLSDQFRYPIGFSVFPQYIGMWARRYMIESGIGYEDLGAVIAAQRKYAALNERAIVRKPFDMDAYLASPFIADPFRKDDCTVEADGACALLVTSLERARDLKQRPAIIDGAAFITPKGSGIDQSDIFNWKDWSVSCHTYLADRLWESTQYSRKDIQFAEIYDCFSAVVPMTLEGLGMFERGETTKFIASGESALTGSLPINTHGGLLCEGYLHGMNTVAEAVMQIQGRGGACQVPNNDICLVSSAAMMDGSALVLTGD